MQSQHDTPDVPEADDSETPAVATVSTPTSARRPGDGPDDGPDDAEGHKIYARNVGVSFDTD